MMMMMMVMVMMMILVLIVMTIVMTITCFYDACVDVNGKEKKSVASVWPWLGTNTALILTTLGD